MTDEPLSSPGEGTGSSAPETPYVPKYEKRRNRWLLVTVVAVLGALLLVVLSGRLDKPQRCATVLSVEG